MEAERYPRRIEIRRETYGSDPARALTNPLAAELLERHGRPGSGSEPPAQRHSGSTAPPGSRGFRATART